jgi:hypothetical protein
MITLKPMSKQKSSDFTAIDLLALRNEPEALKVITEKLRVREMGPADHIRTKHEVKAFLEAAGDQKEAEAIVTRARLRREMWQTQTVAQNLRQRHEQRQGMDD